LLPLVVRQFKRSWNWKSLFRVLQSKHYSSSQWYKM